MSRIKSDSSQEFKKIKANHLEQYSEYYSRMSKSIDYIESQEKKFVDIDLSLPLEIQKMYPEIGDTVSLGDMRKISQVHFRKTIVEPLLESLDEDTQKLLNDVWVGHLPIHRVNACCMHVPRTCTPVIIIYDKMFASLSFRSEATFITGELHKYGEEAAFRYLCHSSQKIVDYYNRDIPSLPLYKLPQDVKLHSLLLASAQELFLVAHELAHIYLGHLDSAKRTSLNLQENDVSFEYFSFSQKRELEADLLASKWIIDFKNKKLAKDILVAANEFNFVMEIFAFIYFLETNALKDAEKMKSHPPTAVRVRYIYSELKDSLNVSECAEIENMLDNFEKGFDFPSVDKSPKWDLFFSVLVDKLYSAK